jgi:hypothetical protein
MENLKMITIRDLKEQFEIQGAYQIATYNNETEKRIILVEGFKIGRKIFYKRRYASKG